jgi:hypothetical protein
MDLWSWLGLTTALVGVAAAVYGAAILLTGRALRGDQRAFRRLKDAGFYYLCFGMALTLLVSGVLWIRHHQTLPAVAALVVTIVLAGLVIRYRPRRSKQR